MRYSFAIAVILGGMAAMLSFSSCNGIMDEIYDKPSAIIEKDYGFIRVDTLNKTGSIYLNASEYDRWMYIDFHTYTIDSLSTSDNVPDTLTWDIAIHRYDIKTNNASVLETEFTNLSNLKTNGNIPSGEYVKDQWTTSQIIVDMSGMMQGNIKYTESYYNAELSKWLAVDKSTMPPIYTLSNKVYIVKLKDGSTAALRFNNYRSNIGTSGFVSLDYIYPLVFK